MASRAAAAAAVRAAGAQLQGYYRRSAFSTAAAAAAGGTTAAKMSWKHVGEYVPVYVSLGLIALSVTLGLNTARHELAHAPNVRLRKRRREVVAEVADPDLAIHDAERFVGGSLFRKVAHVQDDNRSPLAAAGGGGVADYPVRKAVTLKDVGVDPPGIEQGGMEGILGKIFRKKNIA